MSVTGGHLGAGLGVVELTVAIHSVFNTPNDKLIWDVGHQCYPHKVITGRRDKIRTIRRQAGYMVLQKDLKANLIHSVLPTPLLRSLWSGYGSCQRFEKRRSSGNLCDW